MKGHQIWHANMTPPMSGMWCKHWKRKMQHVLYFIILYFACTQHSVLCCTSCKLTLTSPSGHFTSPCYPQLYPNIQDCKWTIQAPPGFIIQVTFVDFDIEEAQNCMYDSLSINNGESTSKFCGVTAKGMAFHSAGNEMILTFVSDFSIQKKGFNATYKHVAVSLRNQKVIVPQNQSSIVSISSKVSIPTLNEVTVCFEATKYSNRTEDWKAFSYWSSSSDHFSFGKTASGHFVLISGVQCDLDTVLPLLPNGEFFIDSFQQICIVWNSLSDVLGVRTKSIYQNISCPGIKDLSIPGQGNLILGTYEINMGPLQGDIYNFRLWSTAMDSATLSNLSCDEKGNIVNWENEFWNIPSWARKAESKLSCGTSLPTIPSAEPTTCEKLAGVCQATVTSIVTPSTTTNTHPTTNTPAFHATSVRYVSSLLPTLSTYTTDNIATYNTQTEVVSAPLPSSPSPVNTSTSITSGSMKPEVATSHLPPVLSTVSIINNIATNNSQPVTVTSATTTMITTNMTDTNSTDPPTPAGTFYRISITVVNSSTNNETTVQSLVYSWLNRSLQNWNYTIFVVNVSIKSNERSARDLETVIMKSKLQNNGRSRRDASNLNTESFVIWALLVYNNTNNITLQNETIYQKLYEQNKTIDGVLSVQSVTVYQVEKCKAEESPSSYHWPVTSPTVTQIIQCPKSPGNYASRTCFVGLFYGDSHWGPPDHKNCTASAGALANELLNLTTGQKLDAEKVNDFVQTLKKIVNEADIDTSLGSTVVNVFSNILGSSDNALYTSSSEALKTIEALALKLQFTGQSVSISSPNLALGISRVNTTTYSGSTFSVGSQSNNSDFQIDMEKNQTTPLASVVLPSTLLSQINESDKYTVSRAQFMFFNKVGLFQDHLSNISSYIVACSIGNLTIRDLKEPVKITVKHTAPLPNNTPRTCVFWDANLYKSAGGWNKTGCDVSENESSDNETVCLCNHLTHFGILMDLQRNSPRWIVTL
uniref:Uncharacterized protein n=1 Tax=Leptobrachium leishanense TaxID=445787 RepID=A0A8C5Q4H8_9ANUR